MTQLVIEINPARKARLENLCKYRGCTLEQFFEPWLADADTHMGHNPADDPEDQAAAAERFARKATKAKGEREEAAIKQQEAAILAEANSGKEKEGKDV